MDTFKIILLLVLCLVILAGLFLIIMRQINSKKTSKAKLESVNKAFLDDDSIHDGGVYIKNIKSGKEHKISKGDINNKRFYLASVTKLFTHSLIFQLIDEGLISHDQAISAYLDKKEWQGISVVNGVDYSGQITIKQLLDQTSGLADYESDFLIDGKHIIDALVEKDFPICYQSALDATRTLKPVFKPGQGNRAYYSNLNALILGNIAEKVCGKPLHVLYKDRIFKKLGLKNTHLAKISADIVPVYYQNQAKNPIKYISSAPAAGGLVSDLDDTMKFLEAFFTGQLFDKSHLNNINFKAIQFFPLQYGGGIMKVQMNAFLSPLMDAPEILGHSGTTGSFAFYQKESGCLIVGTINQAKSRPFWYIYSYMDAMK